MMVICTLISCRLTQCVNGATQKGGHTLDLVFIGESSSIIVSILSISDSYLSSN